MKVSLISVVKNEVLNSILSSNNKNEILDNPHTLIASLLNESDFYFTKKTVQNLFDFDFTREPSQNDYIELIFNFEVSEDDINLDLIRRLGLDKPGEMRVYLNLFVHSGEYSKHPCSYSQNTIRKINNLYENVNIINYIETHKYEQFIDNLEESYEPFGAEEHKLLIKAGGRYIIPVVNFKKIEEDLEIKDNIFIKAGTLVLDLDLNPFYKIEENEQVI